MENANYLINMLGGGAGVLSLIGVLIIFISSVKVKIPMLEARMKSLERENKELREKLEKKVDDTSLTQLKSDMIREVTDVKNEVSKLTEMIMKLLNKN